MAAGSDLALSLIIKVEDEASGPLGKLKSGLSGVGDVATTIAKTGLVAAAAGATALAGALAFSVKAASEAQEIESQLDAVLKSTGGAAGVTKDAVLELANAFGTTTQFEDDAIVKGESMLLTFTNIGSDVFPAATEAMLNMSQALGQDLQSSAIQLGKALNDPVAGVTALQRVGVKLTESQKALVKSLVAVGDVAGAQKVILQELQTEFGGSAKAAGQTFAGQLTILKNSLGNVAETIGGAVLPVLTSLGTTLVSTLNSPAVQGAIKTLSAGLASLASGDVQAAFQSLLTFVYDVFGPETALRIMQVGDAIAVFAGYVRTLGQYFTFTVQEGDALNDYLASLPPQIQPIVQRIGELALMVQEFVTVHAEGLKNALIAIGAILAGAAILSGILAIAGAIAALVNPVTLIIGAVALLAVAWTENWGGIQEKTQAVLDFLMPYITAAFEFIKTTIFKVMMAVQTFWAENGAQIVNKALEIWDQVMGLIGAAVSWIQNAITTVVNIVTTLWAEKHDAIMTIASTTWEQIKNIVKLAVDIVQGFITVFTDLLKGDWGKAWEDVKTLLNTAWEDIKKIVSTAITLVQTYLDVALGLIKIVVRDKWEEIKTAIADKWEEIKTMVGEKMADVKKAITDKFNDFIQVGKDLIQGLINGVGSMAGALVSAAASLAQQAIDAIKRALGIGSPSKVFFDIGIDTAQGMVDGMASQEGAIAGQAAYLANIAASAANVVIGYWKVAAQAAASIPTLTGPINQDPTTLIDPPWIPGDPAEEPGSKFTYPDPKATVDPTLDPGQSETFSTYGWVIDPKTGKFKSVKQYTDPTKFGRDPVTGKITTTTTSRGGGGGGGGGSGGTVEIGSFAADALEQLRWVVNGDKESAADFLKRAVWKANVGAA
jgi:phage-related protein